MMNISTEYFMERLANGESMENIGAQIAAMMNEAQSQYVAAQAAEAAKDEMRTELVNRLVNTAQELAILEGFPQEDIEVTEADAELLADLTVLTLAATPLIRLICSPMIAEYYHVPEATSPKAPAKDEPKSDDEILANFLRGLVS